MIHFSPEMLAQIKTPADSSHKGQNGKLLIVGGSHLFHAAGLWALTVASRIVDMVFYASAPDNNEVILAAKKEFRNGIVIPREKIDDYIKESDAILIGPGMVRSESVKLKVQNFELGQKIHNLSEINQLPDEGEQTYWLTKYLLANYPQKKFILDAGALQMMEPEWLLPLSGGVILTPHQGEFGKLFEREIKDGRADTEDTTVNSGVADELVHQIAVKYNCIILLKGREDIVCSPADCIKISGGNAGMTKGGTGDVLAGLVAGLSCKNDLFQSACAGSFINKKAGESLYERVGYYFNASDLANEIPVVMKTLVKD